MVTRRVKLELWIRAVREMLTGTTSEYEDEHKRKCEISVDELLDCWLGSGRHYMSRHDQAGLVHRREL